MDDFSPTKLFSPRYIENAGSSVSILDPGRISESVAFYWFTNRTENLSPAQGATEPVYPKGDAYYLA